MYTKQSPTRRLDARVIDDAKVYVVSPSRNDCRLIKQWAEALGASVSVSTTAAEFLDEFSPSQPGCVVLDMELPDMSGIEVQHELAGICDSYPIVMIYDECEVQSAVRMIRAGALELLRKPFDKDAMLNIIRIAIRHYVAHRADERELTEISERLASLTSREREVLERISYGHLNKQIAFEFGISEGTVEHHRSRLMRKMQVGSVAELMRCILRLPDFQSDLPIPFCADPTDEESKSGGTHSSAYSNARVG